jgi:hypothetical protein
LRLFSQLQFHADVSLPGRNMAYWGGMLISRVRDDSNVFPHGLLFRRKPCCRSWVFSYVKPQWISNSLWTHCHMNLSVSSVIRKNHLTWSSWYGNVIEFDKGALFQNKE